MSWNAGPKSFCKRALSHPHLEMLSQFTHASAHWGVCVGCMYVECVESKPSGVPFIAYYGYDVIFKYSTYFSGISSKILKEKKKKTLNFYGVNILTGGRFLYLCNKWTHILRLIWTKKAQRCWDWDIKKNFHFDHYILGNDQDIPIKGMGFWLGNLIR